MSWACISGFGDRSRLSSARTRHDIEGVIFMGVPVVQNTAVRSAAVSLWLSSSSLAALTARERAVSSSAAQ